MMTNFKSVKWMTAEQKEKILKLWVRFLKNGFERRDFTKDLYHHLMQNCGFIAHYNINGFFAEYFERGEDKIRFLNHFDLKKMRGHIFELNLNGDYGDLNTAMITEASKFLPVLYAGASAEQKDSDLKRAAALLSKHGLTVETFNPNPRITAPIIETPVQTSLF